MIKKFFIISITIYLNFIFAQDIKNWASHISLNTPTQIEKNNSQYWVSTTGGIYFYDLDYNNFRILNKATGLSGNNVSSIAIDNNSNIWIGTAEGYINIIDPNTENVQAILDIHNSNKTKKQINQILISGNSAFIATDFGISKINISNKLFEETYLKFGNFPTNTKVNYVFKDALIYVATENGIAIQKNNATNLISPDSWKSYNFNNRTIKIFKFNNDIYCSTENTIYKFYNNSFSSYYHSTDKIIQLKVINNKIHLLQNNRLVILNNQTSETIYENHSCNFFDFIIDNSKIIIATNKGILEKNNDTKFYKPDFPFTNNFENLSVDDSGNLFVATGRDGAGTGIYKFDGLNWTIFNKENYSEIKSNNYHNVRSFGNSTYFLNWGIGFTKFENNILTNYDVSNTPLVGIPFDNNFLVIDDAAVDSKNNLWILNFWSGVHEPLSMLTKDGKWYSFTFPNSIAQQPLELMHLAIDKSNTKWFTGIKEKQGLFYFNEMNTPENPEDDIWGYISNKDGLRENSINTIIVDKRNTLWVGHQNGIDIISEPSQPKLIKTLYGPLYKKNVNVIAVDPINNKWVGTSEGLFYVSADGYQLIKHFDKNNSPLPSDNISSIAINNKNGTVYVGTRQGLVSFETVAIAPEKSFDKLYVYPNPFILNGTNTHINIKGLVENSTIKILKVTGELVVEFESPGGNIATWDGKNKNGNLVSSGIYIVVAFDSEASKIGFTKIAIIRK